MTTPDENHGDETVIARRRAAAERALTEARMRQVAAHDPDRPTELGGRKGPEPTRFGDWERNGLTSDF